MTIRAMKKHLMENYYVTDATFKGVDDLGSRVFEITTTDGKKEAWKVRKGAVYYYSDSEDEWKHVSNLK